MIVIIVIHHHWCSLFNNLSHDDEHDDGMTMPLLSP